jgi:hypothetical protein
MIQYSKPFTLQVQPSWNQPNAPLLIESFPKIPRTWSEAPCCGESHKNKTKQNKLPCFIDRWQNEIVTYDDLVHFSSPKMNWVVKLNPTFVILSWWINNKSFHLSFSKSIDHAIYKLHLLDAIVWNIEDHIKQVAF